MVRRLSFVARSLVALAVRRSRSSPLVCVARRSRRSRCSSLSSLVARSCRSRRSSLVVRRLSLVARRPLACRSRRSSLSEFAARLCRSPGSSRGAGANAASQRRYEPYGPVSSPPTLHHVHPPPPPPPVPRLEPGTLAPQGQAPTRGLLPAESMCTTSKAAAPPPPTVTRGSIPGAPPPATVDRGLIPVPEERNTGQVKVYSIGYKDLKFKDSSKHLTFQEKLVAEFQITDNRLLVLTCAGYAPFHGKDGAARNHCGENYDQLKSVSANDIFFEHLVEVYKAVNKFFNVDKSFLKCFNIVCYDVRGSNSSVAVARLVAEVLRRSGFTVKRTTHLSQLGWDADMCTTCKKCSVDYKKKETIYSRASEVFAKMTDQ